MCAQSFPAVTQTLILDAASALDSVSRGPSPPETHNDTDGGCTSASGNSTTPGKADYSATVGLLPWHVPRVSRRGQSESLPGAGTSQHRGFRTTPSSSKRHARPGIIRVTPRSVTHMDSTSDTTNETRATGGPRVSTGAGED